MKTLLGTLFLLLLSVPAQAVTITFAAEPERQLVGLSPALRIVVRNDGSTPVEVPVDAALQVVPPRGEPFVAYSGLRGEDRILRIDDRPFTLAPGEMRDLSFGGSDHWFGADDRFKTHGTFRLQLIVATGLDSGKLAAVNRVVDQPGLVQPIVSNETVFTAIEPTGRELEIWNLIKETGTSGSLGLAKVIWERYPDSGYAPWFVPDLSHDDTLKRIAALEAAIAKGPAQHAIDSLQLLLARNWTSRGEDLDQTDVEAAMAAYNHAQALFQRLSKEAISRWHAKEAAELLADLPTREEVVRTYNEAHGVFEKVILIGTGCYETLPDGQYRVWWGYDNLYNQPLEIPIGPENKFTPSPFDRKQPTAFTIHRKRFAFSVTTKEPVLTWHLLKKTAQFRVKETMKCMEWFDPKDSRTWTIEKPDHLSEPPPD